MPVAETAPPVLILVPVTLPLAMITPLAYILRALAFPDITTPAVLKTATFDTLFTEIVTFALAEAILTLLVPLTILATDIVPV